MGGIKVNLRMETRIKGLFAAGEAVGGANGANRLSGNAIPEAFVFGIFIAGEYAAQYDSENNNLFKNAKIDEILKNILNKSNISKASNKNNDSMRITNIFNELQSIMWENVGVIRTSKSLNKAIRSIENIKQKFNKIKV